MLYRSQAKIVANKLFEGDLDDNDDVLRGVSERLAWYIAKATIMSTKEFDSEISLILLVKLWWMNDNDDKI